MWKNEHKEREREYSRDELRALRAETAGHVVFCIDDAPSRGESRRVTVHAPYYWRSVRDDKSRWHVRNVSRAVALACGLSLTRDGSAIVVSGHGFSATQHVGSHLLAFFGVPEADAHTIIYR